MKNETFEREARECFKFLIKHDPPWSLTDLQTLHTLDDRNY